MNIYIYIYMASDTKFIWTVSIEYESIYYGLVMLVREPSFSRSNFLRGEGPNLGLSLERRHQRWQPTMLKRSGP